MAEKVPTKRSKPDTAMEEDLAHHPAITLYVTPPVTKPLLESLQPGVPPPEGYARLHWLLDINDQFFCWELQQVVSSHLTSVSFTALHDCFNIIIMSGYSNYIFFLGLQPTEPYSIRGWKSIG